MKFSDLRKSGHWPTLLNALLYFDVSFTVWTILGAQIGASLGLSPQQQGLMVAVPHLSGAFSLRLPGMLVDRIGAKNPGVIAQMVVTCGMCVAWMVGLTLVKLRWRTIWGALAEARI